LLDFRRRLDARPHYQLPERHGVRRPGPRSHDLRNDVIANWDLGISKDFHPVEKLRVQFRADGLNAWNHPRCSGPNMTVTSGSFGVVSSQSNAPRQVPFGLKLLW
jgi:hypothetical protein